MYIVPQTAREGKTGPHKQTPSMPKKQATAPETMVTKTMLTKTTAPETMAPQTAGGHPRKRPDPGRCQCIGKVTA
jgi:hypothetical protein